MMTADQTTGHVWCDQADEADHADRGDRRRREHHRNGEREQARAAEADAHLTERGFILRRVTAYGFPNALRLTVGSAEANEGVIAALTEFMAR